MDAYFAIFLILLVYGLLLAIPIGLSVAIYRWLTKKGYKKLGLIAVFLTIGALGFYIYVSIFPLDCFYVDDFEYYSELDFPDSGKILAKYASYPDIHGKYYSYALVEFSEKDFSSLFNKVNTDSTFTPDTIIGHSIEFDKVTKAVDTKGIIKIVQKSKLNIAFLNDNKTVIIERRIW